MILEYLSKTKQYKLIDKKDARVSNTTDNLNKMLIASDFVNHDEVVFVCLPNLYQAQKYYDALCNLVDANLVSFYPCDELVTSEMIVSSIEFKLERINTIKDLVLNKKRIVVLSINGLLKYQLSKETWINTIIHLHTNDSIDMDFLASQLIKMGYKRTYTVERVGEFSIRGSIFDCFPINSINPIRIDFFGDDIESIKNFDINTQISSKRIDECLIVPMNELFYDDAELNQALEKIEAFKRSIKLSTKEIDMFTSDLDHLEKRTELDCLTKYIKYFNQETILDLVENKKIYLIDYNSAKRNYEKMISDVYEFMQSYNGDALMKMEYFASLDHVLMNNEICYIDQLLGKDYPLNAKDTIMYNGQFPILIDDLKRPYTTFIIGLDQLKFDLIKDVFKQNNVSYNVNKIIKNEINLLNENTLSFELYDSSTVFIGSDSLFNNKDDNHVHYKSVYGETKRIKSVDELNVGDYVVHFDYGIGIYNGLKTMVRDGLSRDYIHILYAGNDSLYVPLEKIDLVQKYGSTEGAKPRINSLSNKTWEKTKQRVKNKINDISDKLINLYALREASVGFAFDMDNEDQMLFEQGFEYEETPDQMKAIIEMKKDMESNRPMDRLICGDVGYGKTEVAMRGAMKAVLSGKQVAYLAPTTMLSRQHYHTFINRFSQFGAKVELMNRFISQSKQKEILKGLKDGSVDIVIGTHRILSKDVEFKDLGLLIIDEEQRFGVEHKERIKEMKVNVDSLTLTATPIPRTLQMAIMGIKDLSNLNTPPKNRYPVQTYVLPRHDMVIKEALERELARNGQVFYLYNRVEDIDKIASKINKLVPDARICFAHGQMNKYELEEIISDFIDYKYDCLVCTTIIETGIDIPNTNTLIIHDSDRLGLSQLYQIRGRVGRSDKIAYAYLLYDDKKVMTEKALKRLEAIKDFTELGSGFKIAMRDLAIRGAGDILGSDQSGFIDSVGIDLYMKMLNDTILEKQGKKVNSGYKEIGNVLTNRSIPLTYISDDGVRIEIHKKIALVSNTRELKALIKELNDRFGKYDAKLEYYMYEKLFKKLCSKLGVEKIINNPSQVIIIFSKEASVKLNGELLFMKSMVFGNKINFAFIEQRMQIILNILDIRDAWIKLMTNYLEDIGGDFE